MSENTSTPAKPSSLLPRVVTGLVGAALVIGMIFTPSNVVFVFCMTIFFWAAKEFIDLTRRLAPTAPLRSLWLWLPVAAISGYFAVESEPGHFESPVLFLLAGGLVAVAVLSSLFQSSGDLRDAAVGMGLIALAIPYFAAPPVAIFWLHQLDRWLVLLIMLIVAIGDTAAYFIGKAFGRHLLAPRVSPKKTWEGSIGGFLGSLVATAAWCHFHIGEIPPALLVLAAVTSVVAQLGDLVESLIKRGVGVKDSSHVLPGHGGFYDRLDAILLAAPVFASGLWLIGPQIAQ